MIITVYYFRKPCEGHIQNDFYIISGNPVKDYQYDEAYDDAYDYEEDDNIYDVEIPKPKVRQMFVSLSNKKLQVIFC